VSAELNCQCVRISRQPREFAPGIRPTAQPTFPRRKQECGSCPGIIVTASRKHPRIRCNHLAGSGGCASMDGAGLHSVRAIDHLKAGYIVGIEPDSGFVRTLYRPDSRHNTLFVTERCNSNCLMCSQPPVDKDDIPQLTARNLTLLDLISPAPEYLCITGGEPTLLEDNLFAIFSKLRDKMPETFVHMYQRSAFCVAGVYVELCGYQTPEFQCWHTSVLRPGGATRLRCPGQECLRPNYPRVPSASETWDRN
jgi:sulfatase maturation enzyme AslB (radical SAM superfamily)